MYIQGIAILALAGSVCAAPVRAVKRQTCENMAVNARGLEAISCIATSDSIDYVEPIPITEPIMTVPDVEPAKKTKKVRRGDPETCQAMNINSRGIEAISCIATSDSIDFVEPTEPESPEEPAPEDS
ncbi:hypothetical protein BGZ60DRAFT_433661 [Tricladium varicosporioides]|nr:hypothetical protein BGZ60DRAFT_433661 [Hymenoscyphus varicosporioides]